MTYEKIFKILVPSLAQHYPDLIEVLLINACGFTKSPQAQTRACATTLIGSLCQFNNGDLFSMVCSKLTGLLNDPYPKVRASAAQAIASLFSN
jgi:branched-subunit amino acid permease